MWVVGVWVCVCLFFRFWVCVVCEWAGKGQIGWWCFPSCELHDQIYCRFLRHLFTLSGFAANVYALASLGLHSPWMEFGIAFSSDSFPMGTHVHGADHLVLVLLQD